MEVMVSVICTVYNHERYIRKCLESLVDQEVPFVYEILVNDDASTDASASIIQEYADRYPNLIVPFLQTENQFSKGMNPSYMLNTRSRGKYIAICEGDDFWTDRSKLRRQVEFMESHPEYSLCTHAAYYADEQGRLDENRFFEPYKKSKTVTVEAILSGWLFATNSMLYRKSDLENSKVPFQGDCVHGDFAKTVYLALKGKVYYLDSLMSAYRVSSIGSLNWGWSRNPDKFVQDKLEFAAMLQRIDTYTDGQYHSTIQKHLDSVLFSAAYAKGDLKEARKYKDSYRSLSFVSQCKLHVQAYLPKTYGLAQGICNRARTVASRGR